MKLSQTLNRCSKKSYCLGKRDQIEFPRTWLDLREREVPKETPFAVPKTAVVVASCGFESDWRKVVKL